MAAFTLLAFFSTCASVSVALRTRPRQRHSGCDMFQDYLAPEKEVSNTSAGQHQSRNRSSSFIDEGSSKYDDYHCDPSEWQDFLQKFGLPDYGSTSVFYGDEDFRDTEKPCSERNVVWFWPVEDHNQAYALDTATCYRLRNWYFNACSVSVFRVSNSRDAEAALAEFPSGSIKHAVLGGHGSPGTCRWGAHDEEASCLDFSVSTVEFLQTLATKMHTHSSILMDSCSVAAPNGDEDNLAQFVTSQVGRGIRVFGAGELLYTTDVQRFDAYVTWLNKKPANVYQEGATCPAWSLSVEPDEDGDCSCEPGNTCVAFTSVDGTVCTAKAYQNIYANVSSWTIIGHINKHQKIFVAGTSAMIDGYLMKPILPHGAVEEQFLDCVEHKITCRTKVSTPVFESITNLRLIADLDAGVAVEAIGPVTMQNPGNGQGRMLMLMPMRHGNQTSGAVDVTTLECDQVQACPNGQGVDDHNFFVPSCTEPWSTIQCGCVPRRAR